MAKDFDKMDFSEETYSGSTGAAKKPAAKPAAPEKPVVRVKNYDVDMDKIKQRVKAPEKMPDKGDYGDDYNADADSFESAPEPIRRTVRVYSAPTETDAQARRREQQEEMRRKKVKSAIIGIIVTILILAVLVIGGIMVYNAVSGLTGQLPTSISMTLPSISADTSSALPAGDDQYNDTPDNGGDYSSIPQDDQNDWGDTDTPDGDDDIYDPGDDGGYGDDGGDNGDDGGDSDNNDVEIVEMPAMNE